MPSAAAKPARNPCRNAPCRIVKRTGPIKKTAGTPSNIPLKNNSNTQSPSYALESIGIGELSTIPMLGMGSILRLRNPLDGLYLPSLALRRRKGGLLYRVRGGFLCDTNQTIPTTRSFKICLQKHSLGERAQRIRITSYMYGYWNTNGLPGIPMAVHPG